VAAVQSGPNWTPPPTIPIKKKDYYGFGAHLHNDADSILESLYCVVVGDVADVSQVHPASFFSVDSEIRDSQYL
jgi:hypothetical protein